MEISNIFKAEHLSASFVLTYITLDIFGTIERKNEMQC